MTKLQKIISTINTYPTDVDLAENPSQVEIEKAEETQVRVKEVSSNFVPVK
jgi:hypothetical protein